MSTSLSKTERIHSLDSLRAIMMMLGIVFHSAITYGSLDYGNAWPMKDPNATNLSNDFIVAFLHSFRMPIFFVMAGFFGAMLFFERSPVKMIRNRVSRIALPFIVFLFILWPTIYFGFTYTNMVFAKVPDPFAATLALFSGYEAFIPQNTFHLWFLYYLALITFIFVGLGLIFNHLPRFTNSISQMFSWIIGNPWIRIVVFSGMTALMYLIMGTYAVETSTSFTPDFNTFIFYFSFYMVGWLLFKSKHQLNTIKKFDWMFTILGIILFLVHFLFYSSYDFISHIVLSSVIVWSFIFGITGLFLRYTSNHSAIMRYISDSSYWVYLVHLTIAAFIPGLLGNWSIPATLKFLIVLIVTGIVCVFSYHFLVRNTFIGKFLNGRRYSRRIKAT